MKLRGEDIPPFERVNVKKSDGQKVVLRYLQGR